MSDASVRGVVVARIKRLERGLMGDVEPVGDGVSELRIHLQQTLDAVAHPDTDSHGNTLEVSRLPKRIRKSRAAKDDYDF